MTAYHDNEWGKPLHGDSALFEFLVLEGAQAGLSWASILARREGYRAAFHGYDIPRVAAMTDAELAGVLADGAIIRNRLKVASVRANARAALAVATEHGSLDAYLWSFVDGRPVVNQWTRRDQVPARTDLSDTLSKALKKRGFGFVGSTICYAFMQATGMVDDHLVGCICRTGGSLPLPLPQGEGGSTDNPPPLAGGEGRSTGNPPPLAGGEGRSTGNPPSPRGRG